MIELLLNYKHILKEYLLKVEESVPSGKSITSYLSPQNQNDFFSLWGTDVKEKINLILRKPRIFYFSPYIYIVHRFVPHTNQMSDIIRYVHIKCGKVKV